MPSWKFLAVAVFSVSMLSACAQRGEDSASSGSSGSSSSASGGGAEVSPLDAAPGSQEDLVISVGDRIFFDYDQSSVRADQAAALDRLNSWLSRHSDVRLLIEGHADERGTTEYNLALGERRANSVREHLIAGGISSTRLQTVSYGEERPAEVGSNESTWAQNRRAQFRVR